MKLFINFKILFLLIFYTLSYTSAVAAIIDVGPQTNTFTGNTRGFWFTAPTDFTITGLGLPTDASTDNFDVSVLRLNAAPPLFSASTSNFDTLFLSRDNAGSALLDVNIDIFTGDIIGILGSRGANSTNSYGSSPYLSNIDGFNVTLTRLLMQADLRNTDPSVSSVSTENVGSIGRVLVDINNPAAQVPEPAAVWLLGAGFIGLAGIRRKSSKVSLLTA